MQSSFYKGTLTIVACLMLLAVGPALAQPNGSVSDSAILNGPTLPSFRFPLEEQKARTFEEMGPGDVGYVPQGFGHYIENASDREDCQTLIVLDSGDYQEIALAEWFKSQPLNVLETNFGQPRSILEKMMTKQTFIAEPIR